MRLSVSGRIAANSLVQLAGTALGMLISLFSFAVIARALGPSSFGDYAAATAFLAIPLMFGEIGLNMNALRELSQHPDRARRVVGSSIMARCAISTVTLAMAVGVAWLLPFNSQVHYAITVGVLGAFFAMVDSSLLPVMQAELRMHWVTLTTVCSRLVILGSLITVVTAGYGFHAIVWVYVAGSAVNLALDAVIVGKVAGIRPNFDVRYGITLLRGTVVLGIAMTCGTAYWYIDRVLLALLRPPEEVGLYGAAFKYVELSFFAVNAISVSIFPILVRAIAGGSRERIGDLLQWSVDLMVIAAVPLCAFSLVLADSVIRAVASSDFAAAAPVLRVLGVAVIVVFLAAPFERALVAGHHEHVLGILNGSALAGNVVVSLIVIPAYGYMGLAIASLAVNSVWLLAAALATRRLYGFTPQPYFAGIVVLAGAAMVAIIEVGQTSYIAVALAILVYGGILVAAPGRGRELARRLFTDIRSQTHVLARRATTRS